MEEVILVHKSKKHNKNKAGWFIPAGFFYFYLNAMIVLT